MAGASKIYVDNVLGHHVTTAPLPRPAKYRPTFLSIFHDAQLWKSNEMTKPNQKVPCAY